MEGILLPKAVKFIIDTLNAKGFEAYIVGGCVRDHLLGKVPKDWDITTSALPLQVKAAFKHTYDTGIEHGTVTVLIDKVGYEVTTYRIDGEYKDNRHPDSVIFTSKLAGDLARRDFTMNAIAYNPTDGFVDEFNGIGDIKNRLIRAVREPSSRFNEDALRMMRALRFSAQLGFDIEQQTRLAIQKNAALIKNISMERIRDELLKLILSDEPLKLYELLDCGIADYVLPVLANILRQRESDIKLHLDSIMCDTVSRLAFLLYSLDDKQLTAFLKDLRLDNKTIKDITSVSALLKACPSGEPYELRLAASRHSFALLETALRIDGIIKNRDVTAALDSINTIKQRGDCCTMAQLAINGSDLKAAGVENGKTIGDCLKSCLDEVLRYPEHNNKEYLLREVCNLCTH